MRERTARASGETTMYRISALLLLLLATTIRLAPSSASPSSPLYNKVKTNFLKAMQDAENEYEQRRHTQRQQTQLQKQLLRKATFVRNLEGDNDDDASYISAGDQDDTLDLSRYALKYIGCQNIHTWNDDLAEAGSSPLAMNRFVMFRLCEIDSCSNYNRYGCNSNYGEYMIPMDDYLQVMSEYHVTNMKKYCKICKRCLNMESHVAYYTTDDDAAAADADAEVAAVDDDAQYQVQTDDHAAGQQQDDWSGYNRYWGNGNNNGNANDDGGRRGLQYYGNYGYNNGNNGNNYYSNNYGNYNGAYYGNNNKNNNGNNYAANRYNNNWSNNNGYYSYNTDYNSYNNYQNYNNNYDNAQYANDDANAQAAEEEQQLDDDDYVEVDEHIWYANDEGKCIFEAACSDYKDACSDISSSSSQDSSSESYLTCTEFKIGNNNAGYLGPHCRSDGKTIGVGIYDDEDCYNYVGDVEDISKITGKEFNDNEFADYYDSTCISCQASEEMSLITDDAINTQNFTYPLCTMLYETAAKCNIHVSGDTFPDYQDNQEETQQSVCDYIGSLVENNYDEYGEAIIVPAFKFSKMYDPQQYYEIVNRASTLQILSLALSSTMMVMLLIYACYLQKKLFYRVPWRPPSKVTQPSPDIDLVSGRSIDARSEAGRLSRINSGIAAMRSTSMDRDRDNSYYAAHFEDNSTLPSLTGAFA